MATSIELSVDETAAAPSSSAAASIFTPLDACVSRQRFPTVGTSPSRLRPGPALVPSFGNRSGSVHSHDRPRLFLGLGDGRLHLPTTRLKISSYSARPRAAHSRRRVWRTPSASFLGASADARSATSPSSGVVAPSMVWTAQSRQLRPASRRASGTWGGAAGRSTGGGPRFRSGAEAEGGAIVVAQYTVAARLRLGKTLVRQPVPGSCALQKRFPRLRSPHDASGYYRRPRRPRRELRPAKRTSTGSATPTRSPMRRTANSGARAASATSSIRSRRPSSFPQMRLPPDMVIAGLLHDVPEDTTRTLEEIEAGIRRGRGRHRGRHH